MTSMKHSRIKMSVWFILEIGRVKTFSSPLCECLRKILVIACCCKLTYCHSFLGKILSTTNFDRRKKWLDVEILFFFLYLNKRSNTVQTMPGHAQTWVETPLIFPWGRTLRWYRQQDVLCIICALYFYVFF